MPQLPPRYDPVHRLGAGGAGEVWSVRDRVSGQLLAFKVLSVGAGEAEASALVREAVALSGLEGLGVPRVVAFGALADGRRYLVRELVEGESLEELLDRDAPGVWTGALATACDQLTVVHRAGLLHGDIKPANIIVGADGRGTLVDLGLAAPWREGGATAQGLTPKYAAPELLAGEPLTVRAEVFALGVTLKEAMDRRGAALTRDKRAALAKVAKRATQEDPSSRWPSVDELASALRLAAGLAPSAPSEEPPWPVVGLDVAAQGLLDAVCALPPGTGVAIEGPRGAGKTTIARRLAWTLGAQGRAVAFIEARESVIPMADAVRLELEPYEDHRPKSDRGGRARAVRLGGPRAHIVVVDDADRVDDAGRAALTRAAAEGARLVVVAPSSSVARLVTERPLPFVLPALAASFAEELVRRAVPSLPDALRKHLVERTGRRPGPLRAAVRQLAGLPIVSKEDVDTALDVTARPSCLPTDRIGQLDQADRAINRGRFDEAAMVLDTTGEPRDEAERVRMGSARARIALGRGDAQGALNELAVIEASALNEQRARPWRTLKARAHLRAGHYAEAAALAKVVLDEGRADALAADALSVSGVALAFTGNDTAARTALDEAIHVAAGLGEPRVEAVALGSAAIAHQRAGRSHEARAAYEGSLAAAVRAEDAATVATMRLNLAGLAHAEGDLAQALVHLEAAVDMGRRAGSRAAVTQALLNLANLDLYLGRWARARGSIEELAARRKDLAPAARSQLLGLEAEHDARTGEASRAAALFEQAALAWEAQGRTHDAAESRLEGLLARARASVLVSATEGRAQGLAQEFEGIRTALGEVGFGEHAALAELVRGAVAYACGDEDGARRALDAAVDAARAAGRNEWQWQALDARARLAAAQGAVATARRDTDAALAMLEETAAKLPRDLREVFWDDPRRRALREAHTATSSARTVPSTGGAQVHSARIANATTSAFAGLPAEDRLARILEITRELAREHDMARLLQRVTDHAVALLGAERGFVVLVGPQGELEAHTARTRAGGDDPHGIFSHSVAERVVRTNEPVITASARDDARLSQAVSVHQLMIQSIACVPIRGAPPHGQTIGALYVETRLRPAARFEDEVPTLLAFADQAAIAIENARLLAENRTRADELARTNVELETARDELAKMLGRRTEQLAEARRDLKQVRAEIHSHFGYAGLVGTSAAMRRVYALVERVKDTDVPLLVTGESGTGKEMIARAVHQAGARAKKPFVGLNCGAIPSNLLESELFGSVRGAFTGADRDRGGLFREANEGTLLLDEIGEMPEKMQTGLLRVLQEKRVRPVGGAREEPVDVRVIAATHRDLAQMVAEGTFREDLFYRLHVVELHAPALRERVEDVPLLIDHFISLFSTRYRRERKTITREAVRKMCSFPWPGNVRQLEHVLLSAWLMTDGTEIGPDDLEIPALGARTPRGISEPRGRHAPVAAVPPRAENKAEHKAVERERILSALTASNWNRAQAAKLIGVPRRTFYRRLKEFALL